MDQNYAKIYREKKKYTALILMIISIFVIIFIYGDLKGFYGKRGILALIILFLSVLYFIWRDELKMRGIYFGFRRQKSAISQYKQAPRINSSGIKEFNRNISASQPASIEKNQNKNPLIKNQQHERIQEFNSSYIQHQPRYSQQENQVYMRIPSNESQSLNQRQYQDRGYDRLESHSAQYQHQGMKQDIQKKKITETRKWGNKTSQQDNNHGLLGIFSQTKEIPHVQERRGFENHRFSNPKTNPQQNLVEQTRKNRDALFEQTLGTQQREFKSIDQLTNSIQKSKIYAFHIIKERSSSQLKNILEINKLLFEQFNLILVEAEIAQNIIQELENRYDLINSDKKRVTIDDLYNFRNTFQKSKHSIWHLPYEHSINLELICQLIDMIETREQLDSVLEVKGYNFFEIRTHVLTRLFYMYNQQDCEDDQKKQIQDKFPTDIEIVAHCLFLNINEICQQQKDLTPCKIEVFEVNNEEQLIPIHGQNLDRFFILVCNKINFEPYFMLQVGKDILYSIQGPPSFFNCLVYYFMHLKNNIFHSLSYSECKEILESPAKYILNYENEYRKGYDRYYI